jgi:uncharacterized protein YcbX
MTIVGTVESLWRYPIKSMAGEAIKEAFVSFAGIYGDRIYGFVNSAAPAGTPFLTARDRYEMLLYRPRFRDPVNAAKPPNQAEAEKLGRADAALSKRTRTCCRCTNAVRRGVYR